MAFGDILAIQTAGRFTKATGSTETIVIGDAAQLTGSSDGSALTGQDSVITLTSTTQGSVIIGGDASQITGSDGSTLSGGC